MDHAVDRWVLRNPSNNSKKHFSELKCKVGGSVDQTSCNLQKIAHGVQLRVRSVLISACLMLLALRSITLIFIPAVILS